MSGVPAFALTGRREAVPGVHAGAARPRRWSPAPCSGSSGPTAPARRPPCNCIAGLVVPEAGFGGGVRAPRGPPRAGVEGATSAWSGRRTGSTMRWTAEENLRFLVRFHPGWSDQRVERLADRLGLPLDKKVEQLSKGHLAKLAMVAALGPRTAPAAARRADLGPRPGGARRGARRAVGGPRGRRARHLLLDPRALRHLAGSPTSSSSCARDGCSCAAPRTTSPSAGGASRSGSPTPTSTGRLRGRVPPGARRAPGREPTTARRRLPTCASWERRRSSSPA